MDFEFDDSGTILKGVPEGTENAKIPKQVQYIYGEASDKYAFIKCKTTLKSFSFEEPSNLREIQKFAFYQCKNLTTVDLSQCVNLNKIDDSAFAYCNAINTLNLPENGALSYIGSSCFISNALVNVKIPASVSNIGNQCFQSCSALQSITFADDSLIRTIPIGFVLRCTSLINFTLPKNAVFGGNSLGYCTRMQNCYLANGNNNYYGENGVIYSTDKKSLIYYPAGRISFDIIDDIAVFDAFCLCGTVLTEITVPDGVTSLEQYTFAESQIANFHLPTSLNIIEHHCFYWCQKLTTIEIPDNVTTIGANAFDSCKLLAHVYLPSSLQTVGGGIFKDCSSSITFEFGAGSNLKYEDDMITDVSDTFISMSFKDVAEITIKSSIKIIKSYAFSSKENLNTIIFEGNSELHTIESHAFENSKQLETISFPGKLKTIDNYAFSFCNLTQITFPSSLSKLGDSSFSECHSLQTIEFENPNSISSLRIAYDEQFIEICSSAFYNCYSLSNINLPTDRINSINSYLFYNCSSLSEITIPSSVSVIEEYAFCLCSSLEEIDLYNTQVSVIPNSAFEKCYKLKSYRLPSNCLSLGSYAFASTSIEEVSIPSSLKSINNSCFYNCSLLTTFNIPENSELEIFDSGIFEKCTSFSTINISQPNEKFTLFNEALYDKGLTQFIILPRNSSIKYISFPESLTTIRSKALLDCKKIEVIFIPSNSITTISSNAFKGCSNLQYINIPSSVINVDKDAFYGCNRLQCGLVIEKREPEFLNMLTTVAKMPTRCISKCKNECTGASLSYSNHFLVSTVIAFLGVHKKT